MTAEAHVVFGTGPAGRAVAAALLDQGARSAWSTAAAAR